jgi:hypothetical protein
MFVLSPDIKWTLRRHQCHVFSSVPTSTIQQPPKQPTSALANQLSELPTFSSTKFFRRSLIHSIFSATLLLSIAALFREPKAREDLQLDKMHFILVYAIAKLTRYIDMV